MRTLQSFCTLCCSALLALQALAAPVLEYTLLQTLEHDATAFTQGLVHEKGLLYESSGLYSHSFLMVYQADTGKVLKRQALPPQIFAEGLSKVGNELFLLTWRKGILFRFDANTLRVKRTQKYQGEGWGLAKVGQQLAMSNGSHQLSFRDPDTFKVLKTVSVQENSQPINKLNELEYDGQQLWANRWQSTWVYRIDPEDGSVTGKCDLSALVPRQQTQPPPDVLNGMAYVAEKNAFWVTGKKWSKRYLIQFKPEDKK